MRSSSLPLLLACAFALALPSAALALDFSPFRQPATFDELPIDGTDPTVDPVVNVPISGTSKAQAVQLPFGYFFFGQYYEQINIGTSGLITFGTNAATSGTNTTIPATAAPNAYVAAFWDLINCPAGALNYQSFGPVGSRTLVVEWNRCVRSTTTPSDIQMQIWLSEGSPIVRVFYGEGPVGGTWNATVGIEDHTGTKGYYGLDACQNQNCALNHFPAYSMIQYGRSPIADLQSAPPGLQIKGLDLNGPQLTATLDIGVQNTGLTAAPGVTWRYYRSRDLVFDATDVDLGCEHAPLENLTDADGASAAIVRTDVCTFPTPAPGAYRICALLDPQDTVLEAMESNNFLCSTEFVLGADLIGSVVTPSVAGVGADTELDIRVENRGSDPTGEFTYELFLRDCGDPAAAGLLVHSGRLALAGGESRDEKVSVYLAPGMAFGSLCAELIIDEANEVAELVEDNNTASTCYDPFKACMLLSFPNLRVNGIRAEAPHGCFFGDVVNLEAEICNAGEVTAKGFGALFTIDTNTTVNIYETEVVAFPQSCKSEDANGIPYPDGGDFQCLDIGGGQPKCIDGLCHAPCAGNSNADCGGTGLTCTQDPAWVVDGVRQNSCQLVLKAGECTTLRTTQQIPLNDVRTDLPFQDGIYYYSAIADFGMIIGEGAREDDNARSTQPPGMQCWTRKADLEPVELQFMDVVGAGEAFPVFRRVRNHGVVGAVFPYRYVLTSNPNASEWDIVLEIVGHGPIADGVVDPFSDSAAFDTVRIPPNVVGGTYYLGIVIDPNETLPELSDENNALVWCDPQADGSCTPHPVTVIASSLRVTTPSLPAATVGQSYTVQLLAAGGDGSYRWEVEGGELPPGLALSPGGLLQGTVLEPGYFVFRVGVASGASDASATFVIKASAAASPLLITTPSLPPAYLQQTLPYSVELGASGGTPPYSWSCTGLPAWLRLNGNVLSGTPQAAANPAAVTCTVSDQADRSTTAAYTLEVRMPSTLEIVSPRIGDGDIGYPYYEQVTATGGSGQYDWDFADETIPPGLREAEAGNAGALEGMPEACGTFIVKVTVRDLKDGATDEADLPLTIVCYGPSLASNTDDKLPVAVRGQPYPEFQLQAEDAIRFTVVSGALPEGLTLSETGLISGTVAVDARTGPHSLAVEMTDIYGGKGTDALTIVVQEAPRGDLTLVEKVEDPGCSASGETSPAGLLPFAALLALLGLRRVRVRRSVGLAALAAAAVLSPAVASAQNALGYGMLTRDITYQRLENATAALSGTNIDSACSAAIPLPFPFVFYGETYDRVYVNSDGQVLFSTTSTTGANKGIPTNTNPNNFIAPWWDDLEVNSGTDAHYLVRGQAPNREFVVEWLARWWNDESLTPFEMQVSLYEDGRFAMRWGDPARGLDNASVSATVGIEDATASALSMAVIPCSAAGTCKQDDWVKYLQNKEVIFAAFANLRIGSTSTRAEGDAGIEQLFEVTVVNDGPKAVPSTSVDLVISRDLIFDDADFPVGTIPDVAVPGRSETTVGISLALPRALDPGTYYLLARVDPDNEVEEFVEDDNIGGAFRFLVRTPRPDLAIESIAAPTSATPGTLVAVDLIVANLGNLDVEDVPYWIVLSDNEGISAQDLKIHEGLVSVGWMQTAELTDLVEVPLDAVPVGTYYLGAVIDPNNEVVESNELNNLGKANGEFRVTANSLRITTTLPKELQVGAPYCVPLVVEGGTGTTGWSVVEGSLPPGLHLVSDGAGTSLCGAPSTVGVFEFRLQATSGDLTAEAEFSLKVVTVPTQLSIASAVLPLADFNRTYEAGLVANGGRPPYRWTLAGGHLPEGLVLDDDGLIYGIPVEDGSFAFDVKVTDDVARTAQKTIRLQVVGQGRIECATRTLGTLELGEEITGKLRAGGGVPPYLWNPVSVQRYGDSSSGIEEKASPAGIELGASGDLAGAPQRIGRYLWTVEVTDARDAAPDTCAITLEVVAGQGLAVTTVGLPRVLAEQDYSVQLEARGGVPPYRWSTNDLPNGLVLGSSGVVSGKLSTADLQGQESRTFSFLVEVRDQAENRGQAALAVTLTPKKDLGDLNVRTETESGCSTTAGGASLLALGLVALGLRRRR
jgi:uncharacterized protein (TIGR03382 family)